jgi:hypothetical protein
MNAPFLALSMLVLVFRCKRLLVDFFSPYSFLDFLPSNDKQAAGHTEQVCPSGGKLDLVEVSF